MRCCKQLYSRALVNCAHICSTTVPYEMHAQRYWGYLDEPYPVSGNDMAPYQDEFEEKYGYKPKT